MPTLFTDCVRGKAGSGVAKKSLGGKRVDTPLTAADPLKARASRSTGRTRARPAQRGGHPTQPVEIAGHERYQHDCDQQRECGDA